MVRTSAENKTLLKELTTEVNGLLSSYIKVHNLRLREAGSFLSLFKKVDFSQTHELSKEILKEFEGEKIKIGQIREEFYGKFDSVGKEFFDSLAKYFNALYETVKKLYGLTEAQYLKSESKTPLSWSENKRLENAYQEAVKKYITMGEQLNKLYYKLESN